MNTLHEEHIKMLAEVKRVGVEIQKQLNRIAHRTHLFRVDGIPTLAEKRQSMAERLQELMVERAMYNSAASAIFCKIQQAKSWANWEWSDMMLANLTLLCEGTGNHELIRQARKATFAMQGKARKDAEAKP